ncbi:MAG: S41 family peptidase [Bacteroidota bacterium]
MKKTVLFIFAFIAANPFYAQQCNCPESFDWMVQTFEKNDAGFQYVVDKKGKADYDKHTLLLKEQAQKTSKTEECGKLMYSWLRYFRSGHIAISVKEQKAEQPAASHEEIRKLYKNEPTINLTEKQFLKVLETKKNKADIEGVWTNDTYKIGIIADEKTAGKFNGFIIKADSVYWMPKQIKVQLMINDNKTYSADYYMRDHSKQAASAKLIGTDKNVLLLFNNYWKREYAKSPLTKGESILLQFSNSTKPFLEKLSDKTLYLRIPSFLHEQKQFIDSVLAKNDKLIKSTANLIIDIRNGTGGSDGAYSEIIPYLYTNPVREVGVQLYATELNAKAYEEYAKDYTDSSSIRYFNDVAKRMRAKPGTFINNSDEIAYSDTSDTVFPYPQKVAIICNHNNGSTDEQFLLGAKQSRKVKVFGMSTGGMLDISNMNMLDSPDGKFTLGYCMSKSYRIPHYCIDGIGIQPDYFIDDMIETYNWINYTQGILEY